MVSSRQWRFPLDVEDMADLTLSAFTSNVHHEQMVFNITGKT